MWFFYERVVRIFVYNVNHARFNPFYLGVHFEIFRNFQRVLSEMLMYCLNVYPVSRSSLRNNIHNINYDYFMGEMWRHSTVHIRHFSFVKRRGCHMLGCLEFWLRDYSEPALSKGVNDYTPNQRKHYKTLSYLVT